MKYLAILLSFLGGIAPAFAQKNATQAKIDSLEKVVKTTSEDVAKASALCELCWELRKVGQIEAAVEKGEKGLKLANEAQDPGSRAVCLCELGNAAYRSGDYDRAETCFMACRAAADSAGDRLAAAAALNDLGVIAKNKGQFARALACYRKSRALREAEGDRAGAARTLSNMGVVYLKLGDHARALNAYLRSLDVRNDLKDRSGAAAVLNNMGGLYLAQDNAEKALEAYERSLAIFRELGDQRSEAQALDNLAGVLSRLGEEARALELYKKSLAMRRTSSDKVGMAASYNNLGIAYSDIGESSRALEYYQKCRKLLEEIGASSAAASLEVNLALLKLDLGAPAEARALAAKSLEAGRCFGFVEIARSAAAARAKADSALGDYKSAYEHYRLYKQYSDSLNNESQSKEIGRLEAQYEFDKEIEERERLEQEAAERRQMLYWIAAGVFAALLLVAGLLTWGFQTKKKANKQLSAQNAEIIQQSEEISQQRDELHAMNAQITEQRDVLEKAHEEITDSIDYASRIQHALLPSEEAMRQNADVYVYYNARDVVSGDFYWTQRIDEHTALYSAADCTGHGVPGAFMSVLGATTLDTIVREYGETSPDKMLKLLDASIRQSLKQDENKDGSLDGMDLALIKLDKKNRKLYFSSAGRPLFLLRNGEILEYKGAKFPAGGAQHGEKEFPLIEIDLEPGDRIFMCSDGITDQFGGPRGRKFSPRRLKETLLAHQDKSLQAQGVAFAAVFDDWQKSAKQLDDQLLLGLAA